MPAQYDVIVAGVGGMGSAACFHLARRGRRVLGIERFGIPNQMGSSHGLTRIIRLAYFEDPAYVPLLRRAFELWRELERGHGRRLLHMTGCLDVGPEQSAVVAGALESSRRHDLEHELLDGAELMRRFPAYQVPADYAALLEPEGGFLLVEECTLAHAQAARAAGAEMHEGERVLDWDVQAGQVRVRTERGEYSAARLVLAAGPWNYTLLPDVDPTALQPERQVVAWLRPSRPEHFAFGSFPVFVLETEAGVHYGFPIWGLPGVKLGRFHHRHEAVDPETMDRSVQAEDVALLRDFARRHFPEGSGPALAMSACLFTNTPDEHFVIDRLPEAPEVILAGGFSGHGYKFCTVVGELIADLTEDRQPAYDIDLFRFNRLGLGSREAPA